MAQVNQNDTASRPPTPTINENEVTISDSSDLTIYVMSVKNGHGQRSLTKFKVKKETLAEKSDYFAASIRFNRANNHTQIILKDDDIIAMHIWLTYLHGSNEVKLRSRSPMHNADITTIWHLINQCDIYGFDGRILSRYFYRWYDKNVKINAMNAEFVRQLALPCHFFDHPLGFQAVTKWLAYNFPGHITELLPVYFKWKHQHLCPPDFVGE